jgi:hypothetical protein
MQGNAGAGSLQHGTNASAARQPGAVAVPLGNHPHLLACEMASYTSSQQLLSLYRPPPASATPATGPGVQTASWYSVTLLPGR